MQIIAPNYIYTPSKMLENLAIGFDKTIKEIAPFEELIARYPDATVTKLKKNSLIMPGLINSHVHIEFSANKTKLSYGDFINWLYSVIENRQDLINGCDKECMQKACDDMLKSGITTFGAISSHGMDLESCATAKQNVVFFNEVIGSQATMADALFGDFRSRLEASKNIKRDGFYPAIAIHSPYSVHPVLVKKALQIAKEQNLKLTTHFMESEAERDWLDKNEGDFKGFFHNLLKQKSAVCSSKEFLGYFDTHHALLTHVVNANEEELDAIAKQKHTIIHCPISNRLLGSKKLDIKRLIKKDIRWVVATDGLSSNYKLDLFEEMKMSLFMHSDIPLLELAKKLIDATTVYAAEALGLNTGEIKVGKNADMLVLDLDKKPNEEFAIHLILHKYNISKIYINGKNINY